MAFYVGGDTQELEYDFGLKVANSVAECTMKIYKGEVDPDNLPVPTDALWKEVTSQTVLDKLKAQNEITTSNLSADKSTIQWGDKTLTKTSVIKIVDDFVGKVSGSTVENPHNIYRTRDTILISPRIDISVPQTFYNKVNVLDVATDNIDATSNGQIPQLLFSFNLIEIVERKFGTIPKETLAEKIDWLNNNLRNISCKWIGYGSCHTGNKAYFVPYKAIANDWDSYWVNQVRNTSTTPSLVTHSLGNTPSINFVANSIDSNGFVHFLAYTDKARTTDETLLVLSNHGLSQWDIIENVTRSKIANVSGITTSTPNSIVTDSVIGQSPGDSINKYHIKILKVAESGTNETTIKITNHGLATGDYIKNGIRGGIPKKITVIDTNTIQVSSVIGQISGDPIYLYSFTGTQTAESTVIPSTIYTDYVSIELTLKAPENLITATNTLEDIVTDFNGKVSGSLVENGNVSKRVGNSSLQSPASVNLTEGDVYHYSGINKLDNACSNYGMTTTNGCMAQQLFSFNIISAVEKQLGQPIPAVDKVQWCKDNINSIIPLWYGYGSCPNGNLARLASWQVTTSSWLTLAGTNTTNNISIITTTGLVNSKIIDNDGMIHLIAYTDPSDGITPSTIYTDYVKLTIKLKYIPTYDFYTDANQRRNVGLTDIVLVKRQIGDMTSDFTGKVSGSVVENPNIAKRSGSTTSLFTPNQFASEFDNNCYSQINSLNNIFAIQPVGAVSGYIPQQLFSFNLIAIAEKQLGTSIPGADIASKISWLKENLSNIRCDWYGFGSCPSGNKAYLNVWRNATSAWTGYVSGWGGYANTSNSPTLISPTLASANYLLDNNGFVHFLAYTDPSDGITASIINTDYIKLTLTFKSDTVGYEYFTNNSSEISVTTANKASAFLIECDLSPICNALYGGSNSALKSALKSIQADVWAMGSGSNVNQLGYGVRLKPYSFMGLNWSIIDIINNANSITKLYRNIDSQAEAYISANNKIYYTIYSTYKSDGAIPSECNLDYVNIKVNLTRQPDVIAPIPITLGETWSILVKGFSPSWDNTRNDRVVTSVAIFKDNNNRFLLYWHPGNKKFILTKLVNGVIKELPVILPNFLKYQVVNFLFGINSSGMFINALLNNGTVVKATNADITTLTGSLNLFIGIHSSTGYQADAFLENLYFFNNKVFTDIEAEAMLRGTKEGFENPELFDIDKVTLHANATRSGDTITLNATAAWQVNLEYIQVLPNNQYTATWNGTASSGSAVLRIDEYYNSIKVVSNHYVYNGNTLTFTTSSKTNKISIGLQNTTAGTFTFSDISLKRLD